MKDLTIKCKDCGGEFVFSAGEQRFYKEHKLYPPRRCYYCRKKERRKHWEENHGKKT